MQVLLADFEIHDEQFSAGSSVKQFCHQAISSIPVESVLLSSLSEVTARSSSASSSTSSNFEPVSFLF